MSESNQSRGNIRRLGDRSKSFCAHAGKAAHFMHFSQRAPGLDRGPEHDQTAAARCSDELLHLPIHRRLRLEGNTCSTAQLKAHHSPPSFLFQRERSCSFCAFARLTDIATRTFDHRQLTTVKHCHCPFDRRPNFRLDANAWTS